MKSPIVLFDLDGTLAQTETYWIPLMKEFVKEIEARMGFQPAYKDISEILDLLGKPAEEIYHFIYPNASKTEVQAMLDMSQVFWTENLHQFPFHLYPGTLEVLQELKERGYRCFISSNCGIQYLNSLVEETGLEPIIDGAVCRGMHPELEKWEFTRLFLSDLDYSEGWFIGDSYHDMEAGRNNGLKTIFAEYGYAQCQNETLIDYRITNVNGLLGLL